MLQVVRASWPLFVGLGMIMLGNGLQGTLLGLRASLEGFATGTTGLVMSAYYIGFLGGSLLIPQIIGNVGHIRSFAALASLASVAVLVHAIVIDPSAWSALRVITGFSYAGLYIVCESWINDRATNQTRGQLLSVYMLITIGGMAAGQMLLNLAEPSGPELFILTSVLVSLALVPISLTVVSAPQQAAPQQRISLRALYRSSPLAVATNFCAGLAAGALFGMSAVFTTALGLSVAETGYFIAAVLLGGFVLQWPIGWLSDRFDRRRIITATALSCTLVAAAGATITTLPLLYLVAALTGGFAVPLYSLALAYCNDHVDTDMMVAASATMIMVNGSGAALGPLSVSLAMTLLGPGGFFVWLASCHALLGGFALYRMTRREATPLNEQSSFVAIPGRGTAVIAALAVDPRADASGDDASGDDAPKPSERAS